jgi:phosphate transport system permease protein
MNNRLKNNIFKYWAISCTLFGIAMLLIFLINIVIDGVGRIDWNLLPICLHENLN